MAIRPYKEKDKENVRFVCLNSDGPDTFSDIGREFLLTTYCDYYTEQEPVNCFVATDENDNAVGYILCAENFDKFKEIFIEEYTSRLSHSEFHCNESKKTVLMIEKFKDEYPAHLHIDLLPDYHRKGLGTLLMDALCTHLKAKGVKGIMLTLWCKNTNACRFYEKYGFNILENSGTEHAYGLKL
ncbi:MAG: GNAT family N-acetyltransferase [Clostridia bacterium]|nr:GNAT family N-acetyltransferase [Clostridia bacterium]